MARPRKGEHGSISSGRIKLNVATRDIIRAYTRYKLLQARQAVAECTARHKRLDSQYSAGMLMDAHRIESHYAHLYATGQKGLDPEVWAECWRIVTTEERHRDPAGTETQTIPGME